MIGKNKNTMATAGTKTKVSTVLGEGTVFDRSEEHTSELQSQR